MTPEARKDQVLAQEVGDEMVVYDERTHEAHRLNRTAAMVWRHADGRRSVDDIAAVLHAELQTLEAEDLVRFALAELERASLMARGLPVPGEIISRRRMLAVAGALLPVVASIAAPTAQGCGSPRYFLEHPSECLPPSSSSTTTTTASSTSRTQFNGTYTGSGTTSPENCGGFSSNAQLRATLTLDSAGMGRWSKTHVAPNVPFDFPNADSTVLSSNSIRLRASGTFTVGGNQYTVTEDYTITGTSLTGTQTFSRSGCTFTYNVNMTRQAA